MKEIGLRPQSILMTDCRSLFDHVYSMTGSTAELLLPDIHELREATMPWRSALSEDFEEDFVELWWVDTVRQLADNLTKLVTPSLLEFRDVLKTGVISFRDRQKPELKTFERPTPTHRAHSFWSQFYQFLCSWDRPELEKSASEAENRVPVAVQ